MTLNFGERTVKYMALAASVLLHAALFTNLTNATPGSQSQAPKYDTRVSLNFLPTPKTQPQQVVKEVTTPKPVLKKKPAKKRVKAKKKIKPLVQEQAVAQTVSKDIHRQVAEDNKVVRQRYLSKLLTIIEGNKYYPIPARRRGIEGNIHVSFILKEDGYINGLDASGGSAILRRAAKKAVIKSLPLPIKAGQIQYPMHVRYAMQFKLN